MSHLVDLLAELLSEPDARDVVDRVGLDHRRIMFGGNLNNVWSSILREAKLHTGSVRGIVDFASERYPDRAEALSTAVKEYLGDPAPTAPPAAPSPPPPQRLEDPPRICIGRDELIRHVAGALASDPPRPVCVLGHPGIGKSTIAKRALHEPDVKNRCGARRFFVRCDAMRAASGLATELLQQLGSQAFTDPVNAALHEVSRTPAAIVFDNFESPWLGGETQEVESFLSRLAALPGCGVCITVRGADAPYGLDWAPFVQPPPLSPADAKTAFVGHAGRFQDDPDLEPLLKPMGGVPLAIFLLARAARGSSDSLARLARRWDDERTRLLKVPQTGKFAGSDPAKYREVNLEASYEVSLKMVSSDREDEVKKVLAVLSILPDGVEDRRLSEICEAKVDETIDDLNRLGLTYEEGRRIRMLAPLREYAERKYETEGPVREKAMRHFLELVKRYGGKVGSRDGAEALENLLPEAGNIESILLRVFAKGADGDE